jgi:hypothetical protein
MNWIESRRGFRVPTKSVELASALGCRNSCRGAESKSAESKSGATSPTRLLVPAPTSWLADSNAGARIGALVISGRAHAVAHLERQASAGAGESACREDPWGAWRDKSPQPAPHFPAGFPVSGQGRHSMALLGYAAFCSAPFSFLQSHGSRRGAVTSIVQCGAVPSSSRNGGHPKRSTGSTGAHDREFAWRVLRELRSRCQQKEDAS